MEDFTRSGFRQIGLLAALLMVAALVELPGAEGDEPPASPAPSPPASPTTNVSVEAEQHLRTYLKLQEQLHGTLLAIEQARMEASEETRTNAEILATRLELLEKTTLQQREQQAQTLQQSNRTMLVMAGSVVGVGLLALAFSALFQSRGMNRLAEIATGFSNDRLLLAGGLPPGLQPGERLLLNPESASGANKTLLATIDRLENRIQELEQTAHSILPIRESIQPKEELKWSGFRNGNSEAVDQLPVLLGKGQVLLSLGDAENALACFDQAIAANPRHAEANVKRGLALERLKRFDEALASYERAIVLNRSLTQAYLCKGSLFNQQERYSEALECYEQALRSESKA
jgi:tetratricopeptide (TPR) repeat protein